MGAVCPNTDIRFIGSDPLQQGNCCRRMPCEIGLRLAKPADRREWRNAKITVTNWASNHFFFQGEDGGPGRLFFQDNNTNKRTVDARIPGGGLHCPIGMKAFRYVRYALLSFLNWLSFHEDSTRATSIVVNNSLIWDFNFGEWNAISSLCSFLPLCFWKW